MLRSSFKEKRPTKERTHIAANLKSLRVAVSCAYLLTRDLINSNETGSFFLTGSSLDRLSASTKFLQSPKSKGLLAKGKILWTYLRAA